MDEQKPSSAVVDLMDCISRAVVSLDLLSTPSASPEKQTLKTISEQLRYFKGKYLKSLEKPVLVPDSYHELKFHLLQNGATEADVRNTGGEIFAVVFKLKNPHPVDMQQDFFYVLTDTEGPWVLGIYSTEQQWTDGVEADVMLDPFINSTDVPLRVVAAAATMYAKIQEGMHNG